MVYVLCPHHQMVTQIITSFSSYWILFYTHDGIQTPRARNLDFPAPGLPIQIVFCRLKCFRWTALDIHAILAFDSTSIFRENFK